MQTVFIDVTKSCLLIPKYLYREFSVSGSFSRTGVLKEKQFDIL